MNCSCSRAAKTRPPWLLGLPLSFPDASPCLPGSPSKRCVYPHSCLRSTSREAPHQAVGEERHRVSPEGREGRGLAEVQDWEALRPRGPECVRGRKQTLWLEHARAWGNRDCILQGVTILSMHVCVCVCACPHVWEWHGGKGMVRGRSSHVTTHPTPRPSARPHPHTRSWPAVAGKPNLMELMEPETWSKDKCLLISSTWKTCDLPGSSPEISEWWPEISVSQLRPQSPGSGRSSR